MNQTDLLSLLHSNFSKGFIHRYGPVIVANYLVDETLRLTLHNDPRIAFRAAYLLEYAFFEAPDQFTPCTTDFLRNYSIITSSSAHRHYSKIMYHLLTSRKLLLTPPEQQQIAEVTFDRLIDPAVRPAVKVWAMEILDQLSESLPWVDEQLYDTIEFLMLSKTPALRSRGLKICRRIRKRKSK